MGRRFDQLRRSVRDLLGWHRLEVDRPIAPHSSEHSIGRVIGTDETGRWLIETPNGGRVTVSTDFNSAVITSSLLPIQGAGQRSRASSVNACLCRPLVQVPPDDELPTGGRIAAAVDSPIGTAPNISPSRVGGHVPSPFPVDLVGQDLFVSKMGKRKRQWVVASFFGQVWWDEDLGEFQLAEFTGMWSRAWAGNGFWWSKPFVWVDRSDTSSLTETERSKRTITQAESLNYSGTQPYAPASISLIHLGHSVIFEGTFYEKDREEHLETWDYDADVYVPPPQPCDPPPPPRPSGGPAYEYLDVALSYDRYFGEEGRWWTVVVPRAKLGNPAPTRFTTRIDQVLTDFAAYNAIPANVTGWIISGDPSKTQYPISHFRFAAPTATVLPPGFWQPVDAINWSRVGRIKLITSPPPPALPPPEPAPAPVCTPPPTPPVPGINVRRLQVTWDYEYRLQIPGVHLKRSGALARDWKWAETQARRTLDGVEQYNNKTYDINIWVPIVADKTGNAVIVLNLIKTGNATAVLQKKLYWSPSGGTLTELDLAVFEPILFEGIAVYDKGILTINTKDVPDLIVPEDGNPYLARVTRPVQAEAPTTEGKTLTVQFWDLPSGALTTKTERVRSLKIPEDKQIDWYSYHP